MNTVNQQAAPKSFLISIDGEFSAADLQANLNAWLNERKLNGWLGEHKEEAKVANVKQVLDAGYISTDEARHTMELLKVYADTPIGYQNLLDILYNFLTDHGENDIRNGCWDFLSFLKQLNKYFLIPGNAESFNKSGGGTDELSTYLPTLIEAISDIAHSGPARAMLEAYYYKRNLLFIKRKYNTEVLEEYGLEAKAIIQLPDPGKQAA